MNQADSHVGLAHALGQPNATSCHWYRWDWGGYVLEVSTPAGRRGLPISTHGKTDGMRAPALEGLVAETPDELAAVLWMELLATPRRICGLVWQPLANRA